MAFELIQNADDAGAKVLSFAEIAETGTIDEIADRTVPIVRHLLERWSRLGPTTIRRRSWR
jgi:hypothetical protein